LRRPRLSLARLASIISAAVQATPVVRNAHLDTRARLKMHITRNAYKWNSPEVGLYRCK
jgi:hypothetical protein